MRIPPPLAAAARARPQHAAIVGVDGHAVTYAALHTRAARWAGALAARGIGAGATVALVGPLGDAWVTALHAIGLAGAVVAPIDAAAEAPAIEEAVARHTAAWIVDVREDALARSSADLARGSADLARASAGLARDDHDRSPSPGARSLTAGPVLTPAALDRAAAAPLPERDWPLDEPRASILTSGSTGQPRAIVLTTAQLLFSALGSAARLGHHLDDRWLLCLPTHHVGGLSILFRTAWLATTALVEPRFDAPHVAARIDDATLVSLVPTMLARVLDARGERPFAPHLRAILLGGDRAPPALVERARALGAPLALTWGMSETASQIATLSPAELGAWREGLAGPPLPVARVTTDESGALVVEGPLAPGGRLVTTDRGEVRADGAVEVHGRRDLVFISGGENVDPQRVEAALRTHPAIADALVVGLPDAAHGQRAAAALVARPGVPRPSLPDIRDHLAPRLARAERPVRVAWTDALPLGTSGKPSRERARALLQDMEEPS